MPSLPVVALAWNQRGQLAWLVGPGGVSAPGDLALWMAGSAGSVAVLSLLIGLGLGRWPRSAAHTGDGTGTDAGTRPGTGTGSSTGIGAEASSGMDVSAGWLTLPWLLVPPLLLMAVSWAAVPVYTQRYVTYCLPALALAAGLGLARISFSRGSLTWISAVARRISLASWATSASHGAISADHRTGPRAIRLAPRVATLAPQAIVLLLIAGLGLSAQVAERQPGGHGDNIRAAATVLSQHERPGDGVLYYCPTCHFQDTPREFASAYPTAFARLDDLDLAASPAASNTLRGTQVSATTLAQRLHSASRVWLVELYGSSAPGPLADSGLHEVSSYPDGDITVALYER